MTGIQQVVVSRDSLGPPATWPVNLVTSGSQTAYIQFKPNGAIHRTRSGAVDEYIGQWYATIATGIGARFQIYFEPIPGSGVGGGAPSATNVGTQLVWQSLSVERTMGYSGRSFVIGSFRCYLGDLTPTVILRTHIANISIYP